MGLLGCCTGELAAGLCLLRMWIHQCTSWDLLIIYSQAMLVAKAQVWVCHYIISVISVPETIKQCTFHQGTQRVWVPQLTNIHIWMRFIYEDLPSRASSSTEIIDGIKDQKDIATMHWTRPMINDMHRYAAPFEPCSHDSAHHQIKNVFSKHFWCPDWISIVLCQNLMGCKHVE